MTTTDTTTFSTDTAGLRMPSPGGRELGDGDTFDLRIAAVVKQLGDDRVRMLAYNGSIPGPTLRVRQGSEITVHVRNDADAEATVHWHGLRLDNRYDGVPPRPRSRSRSAASSPTASGSRTPACTGTTRTSVRTTASTWACTATSSSSPPTPTTGRR